MELVFTLFAVLATVIKCQSTEEAAAVADVTADAPRPPPSLWEEERCAAVSASDFLLLVNLQCSSSRDSLCVLDWPYDMRPPTNKFRCGRGPASDLNVTDWLPMVHLINASAFVSLAQRERPQQGGTVEEADKEEKEKEKEREKEKEKDWCMIVNFYAPYCPFSARLAPYYNALPRVFPRLYVIGVDATDYSKLNSRYGITGTPTVILWHNGKAVARFDDTDYTLKGLSNFLQQWTDMEPARGVDVADEDLLGPLPSQPIVGRDYYLILSWLFILFCAGYYAARSAPATRIWEAVRTNFREANE